MMFNFPLEKYTGPSILRVEWKGPGWYATARNFPGQEVYTIKKVPEDWFETEYASPSQDDLDEVARSFGSGTLRWHDSEPTA
jgi:hypothetical protein